MLLVFMLGLIHVSPLWRIWSECHFLVWSKLWFLHVKWASVPMARMYWCSFIYYPKRSHYSPLPPRVAHVLYSCPLAHELNLGSWGASTYRVPPIGWMIQKLIVWSGSAYLMMWLNLLYFLNNLNNLGVLKYEEWGVLNFKHCPWAKLEFKTFF